MAHMARAKGELDAAVGHWLEALKAANESGNAEGLFEVSRALGALLVREGNVEEGRPLLAQALEVGRRLGRPECVQIEEQLRDIGD